MSEYNPTEAIAAQDRYCEEHELPCFAPINGICPSCGRGIYLPGKAANPKGSQAARKGDRPGRIEFEQAAAGHRPSGVTVSMAAARLITGCPHCRYSFVE